MSNKKADTLARVVEAAIEAFSTSDYDQVSIGDIAARAHCSTATLYEAFGSKKALYEHIRQHLFERRPRQWPLTTAATNLGLEPLLDHFKETFEALTSPTVGMLINPAEPSRETVYKPLEHSGLDFDIIRKQTEACMARDLLRAGDPYAFAFLMYAGASYEPLLYNITCRSPVRLDLAAILGSVFGPLVTEAGARELTAYIAALPPLTPQASREPSLHGLMHFSARSADDQARIQHSLVEIKAAVETFRNRAAIKARQG